MTVRSVWSLYNKRLRTKPLVLIITDRSLLGWSDNDMGSNEHNYLSSDGQSFIDNDVPTTGPHLIGELLKLWEPQTCILRPILGLGGYPDMSAG